MRTPIILSILIVCLFNPCSSTLGVDISAAFNNFSCFKQNGMSFSITRAWRSYGSFDPAAPQNCINA